MRGFIVNSVVITDCNYEKAARTWGDTRYLSGCHYECDRGLFKSNVSLLQEE